jgi:hypothetical protein
MYAGIGASVPGRQRTPQRGTVEALKERSGAELLRTAEAVRDELPRLEASLDALRAQEEKSRQDAADAVREAQETRQRAQAELRDLFPPGRAADVLEEREYKTGLLSRERVLVATDPDAVASAVQRRMRSRGHWTTGMRNARRSHGCGSRSRS